MSFVRRISPAVAVGSLIITGCSPASTPPIPPPNDAPITLVVARGGHGSKTVDAPPPVDESSAAIPIASDDPVWGSRNALVTIVLFSDLECPFCKRLHDTLVSIRRSESGEDLRIVWKNQPLSIHSNARRAAEAAQGVYLLGGAEAFWNFADLAFASQRNLSVEAMTSWANELGVDGDRVEEGMRDAEWTEKVDRDIELAKQLKVRGTPVMFINGERIDGARSESSLKSTIDKQRERGREALGRGIPPAELYTRLVGETSTPAASAIGPQPSRPPFKLPSSGTVASLKRTPVVVGASPVRGPSDALVTIVEFGDFQCPFTQRVEATLSQLRSLYGRDLRLVWKDSPLPFHTQALDAAELAREARARHGATGFWRAHDAFLSELKGSQKLDLISNAAKWGLTAAEARSALSTHRHKPAVEAERNQARAISATGTPTFFVNGRALAGARSLAEFRRVIDDELKRARALVKSGTPRSKVYSELLRGKTAPPTPTPGAKPNAPHRTPKVVP